ncbi:hypothetical protein D3C73_1647200 [compost metagenome]
MQGEEQRQIVAELQQLAVIVEFVFTGSLSALFQPPVNGGTPFLLFLHINRQLRALLARHLDQPLVMQAAQQRTV